MGSDTGEKKEIMIGYCGVPCHQCAVFRASHGQEADERRKSYETWRMMYGRKISEADFKCDGCLAPSDQVFETCQKCEIRDCARARGVESCAYCEEYMCPKLKAFLKDGQEARERLDAMRNDRSQKPT